jgi:AcrR family transcriptional regulator
MSPATRRRGDALEKAIFDAVFDQLSAVGYAKLTMEGVAAAAQTGKAALYRRWTAKDDLLSDALQHALPVPAEIPAHDNVREDLLALLRCYRDVTYLTSGAVFQVLKVEADESSFLLHRVVRERVIGPLRQMILEALQRAAERGEIRPEAATPQIARIGPAMVMYHCLTETTDIPDDFLVSIVDDILLPVALPRQ